MARKKPLYGNADEIEAAFYDAICRADIITLMSLWAEDEEIVCIHPGAPRLFGHAAIRESWEKIFAAGGLHLRATRVHQTHNMLSAMHNVIEVATTTPTAGDSPRVDEGDVHILATNVYAKTAQGWRIVAHHASFAPGTPAPEPERSALLH